MSIYNYNTICHYGIKGQKWGIRRYQNEDGSLTAEGKKRFDKLLQLKESNENALLEKNKNLENYRKYIKKKYHKDVYRQYPSEFRELLYLEKESEFAKKYIESNEKLRDLGKQYAEEYSKVAMSSHGPFQVIGRDRVNQVLENFKKN